MNNKMEKGMFYFDGILSVNVQMDVMVDTILSWSEN